MDPEVPGSSPGGGTSLRSAQRGEGCLAGADASALEYRSTHARYAAHTARALGFAFRSLDGEDGYLFEVSGGSRRVVFSASAGTPYALNPAHAHCIARDKEFAHRVLRERGLPTIPSRLFFANDRKRELRGPGREIEDALRYARDVAFPVFCKPINGARGAFAEIVHDLGEFERYIARVGVHHYAFVVQPVIEAPEHRVFVLNGRVLFAYEKHRPKLRGDGVSSLAALVNAQREKPGELPETLCGRDTASAAYGCDHVPPLGAAIVLDGAANRALGGASSAPTTNPAPALAQCGLAAAAALQLSLAAADIFMCDDGPVIIEVNANPAIKTLEDHGRWDLIEAVWRANFDAALR